VVKVHVKKMMSTGSKTAEAKSILNKCWELDLNWDLYPDRVRSVSKVWMYHVSVIPY